MIRLHQGLQPQVLIEKGEEWTEEYKKWCEHPVGTEPRRYANTEVRSALEVETNSKCAYCEGRIRDVAYTHIEHKLPKRKHPELVCTWENLTIACPVCNTNKGDYDTPECSLLDPYVDNVEEEVAFFGPLALPRGGARARATITRLDLNRMDLLFARGEAIVSLDRLLDLVDRFSKEPDVVQSLWLEIDAVTASAGEFASTCRHFLASQIKQRGLARP